MDSEMSPAVRRVADAAMQLNAMQVGMTGWADGSLSGLLRRLVTTLESAVDELAVERAQVYDSGRRDAAREIAYKIRAELVCCDVYDRDAHTDRAGKEHAMCFWSEASARFADVANAVETPS
ncbi:hypothetical protein [Micromonospora sp. NPDC047730]|uniref:hypothetical protein n=1 Tax=Micromonospora sp. NPDC047730 TaxID=3364253 RepID=UPI00372445AF